MLLSKSTKVSHNSNFFNVGQHKLYYNGKYYISSEQAYQYTKAISSTVNLAKEILQATDPRKIRRLEDIRESVSWNRQKVAIVREILRKNAACCAVFRKEVGDPRAVFVEAVRDPFWGSGLSYKETCDTKPGHWKGANVMGTLLSQIRNELSTIPNPVLGPSNQGTHEPATENSLNNDSAQQWLLLWVTPW